MLLSKAIVVRCVFSQVTLMRETQAYNVRNSRGCFLLGCLTLAIANICRVLYFHSQSLHKTERFPVLPNLDYPHFKFEPLESDRPLKKAAIVTIYAPETSSSKFSHQLTDVLLLSQSFLRNNLTRINLVGDIEFVVAIAGHLNSSEHDLLLSVGARLLKLPDECAIFEHNRHIFHKPCRSCFAKICLFGLEQFSTILYLDSNVFVRKSVLPLFVRQFHKPPLSAVQSLFLPAGTFDSTVLLFTPSSSHFRQLFRMLQSDNFTTNYYSDQSLLNLHFSDTKQQKGWNRLPSEYNLQHPELHSPETSIPSVFVQHSFWSPQKPPILETPSGFLFREWKSQLDDLHNHLVSQHNAHFVPVLSNNPQKIHDLVSSGLTAARVVVSTILLEGTRGVNASRVMSNRDRYAARYADHVIHTPQTKLEASSAVWQKPREVERAFKQTAKASGDWVWLLDARDAMIMNGDIDVRDVLAELLAPLHGAESVDVVITRDFNGINAGSFFVRNSGWTRKIFLKAWRQYERPREEGGMDEQAAIADMMCRNTGGIMDRVLVVERARQTLFNAYPFGPPPTFRPGDFVLHAASLRWKGLVAYMSDHNLTEF